MTEQDETQEPTHTPGEGIDFGEADSDKVTQLPLPTQPIDEEPSVVVDDPETRAAQEAEEAAQQAQDALQGTDTHMGPTQMGDSQPTGTDGPTGGSGGAGKGSEVVCAGTPVRHRAGPPGPR